MLKAKILLLDIEIIPDLKEALKVWPKLSSYYGRTMRASVSSVACMGYKWLGAKKAECLNAWDFPEWKKDVNNDKRLCKKLHELISEADAVVTQNGVKFDMKFLQTRFLKWGLKPIGTIHHIDTYLLARRYLYLFSNGLEHMGEFLEGEGKLKHEGWDLWVKTVNKDERSLEKMVKYCKQDVNLLEKVFRRLLPFVKNFPNYNLYRTDKEIENDVQLCPNCGSEKLHSKGWRSTKTRIYQRKICGDCGTYARVDDRGNMPRSY